MGGGVRPGAFISVLALAWLVLLPSPLYLERKAGPLWGNPTGRTYPSSIEII